VVPGTLPLAAEEELVRSATLMTQHYSLELEAHLSALLVAGSAVHYCHLLVRKIQY